jgi:hypothetical protein
MADHRIGYDDLPCLAAAHSVQHKHHVRPVWPSFEVAGAQGAALADAQA